MVSTVTEGILSGQVSFALGGSALLFPYYLGILHTLWDTGYVVPGRTRFAGISGGALTASATCAGIHPNVTYNYLVSAVTKHPKDVWAAREDMIRELGALAQPGAYRTCRGKVHIAMSELNKTSATMNGTNSTQSFVVGRFRSDDDLWGAVVGSSTISCAGYDNNTDPSCAGSAYYVYRNRPVLDGAYANNLTTLCHALGMEYGPGSKCVGIYTYVPGVFRKYPPNTTQQNTADTAIIPIGTTTSCSNNTMTARAQSRRGWALPTNCTTIVNSNGLPGFTDTFDPAGPWPSICPGCDPRNPLDFTVEEWQDMAMNSTAAFPNMQRMYDYGRRDAELWVQNQTEARTAAAATAKASEGGRRRLFGGQ